jgi:putative cardiolipin synthase
MHFLKRGSFALLLLLSGCNTQNVMRPEATSYPRTPSHAVSQNMPTALGHVIHPAVVRNPGQSGFRVLETGTESLALRLAMVRSAEKTIDLQYYGISDDVTSNLLLDAILHAAARGVRVRFLLDDISLRRVSQSLAVLDDNKNIEIRVFNPLSTRHESIPSSLAGLITDSGHAMRRMHNKAMIADNQIAIMGGRNLGDEYFDSDPEVDFKDLDILTAGPITAKISASFDQYWNDKNSFPLAALQNPVKDPDRIQQIKHNMRDKWDQALETATGKQQLNAQLTDRLRQSSFKLIWARAELAADAPFKIDQNKQNATSEPLLSMGELLDKADHEFLLTSPYFVPQDDGVAYLSALVKRGIHVRVLTNSLASTDVVLAHTGYQPYRETLVKNGIDLYELKPANGQRPKQRLLAMSEPAHAALHTKVYVVDGRDVMIGSFNFDPRSIDLNTEIALVIHSPEIAARITRLFAESSKPENSYHLVIKDQKLNWMTTEKGSDTLYTSDPKAGFWRRIQAVLMGFLPVENEL